MDFHSTLQVNKLNDTAYPTVLMFSTSMKTSAPSLPLSSGLRCGGTLLRQTDACTLRERLAQMNTVWRSTR